MSFEEVTWNFFKSGHGKGAADGIGGTVKREADRLVTHGIKRHHWREGDVRVRGISW